MNWISLLPAKSPPATACPATWLTRLAFGLLVPWAWLACASVAGADNLPPKVSLAQPGAGAVFTNPSEIQITALVEDADGFVQSVEVFTDLGSLGIIKPDPASASPVNPFQWTWKNPPAGDHKLVAKATDNQGLTSFSDSLVITVRRDSSPSPATLTFVKPVEGAVFDWPSTVSIDLTAVDPNGDIRHVEFSANGVWIGSSDQWTKDAVVPGKPREHLLDWTPAVPGSYQLTAQAVDMQGNPVQSAPVSITVGPNEVLVSIEAKMWETSEPAPNVRVQPAMVMVRRSGPASDPLTVSLKFDGTATAGIDYKALPDEITFLAGETEKTLLVEALEDSVAEGPEVLAIWVVGPAPDQTPDYFVDPFRQAVKILIQDSSSTPGATLEITAPKDGQVFASGEPIKIDATAIDPKGYIARVEFYDGEQQIGVSQIEFFRAPDPGTPIYHTFEWQNPPAGVHALTARAIDSAGNRVMSRGVKIQVGMVSTPALIEITAPQDGQVFAVGEPIKINATAFDPNGYIARVEFYDFDKLIGVSQIEFIRAPDPGTRIFHTFEWQNPPAGGHMLTAKGTNSAGNPVVSTPRKIDVQTMSMLATVAVTAVDPEATELPPWVDAIDPARFQITRTGDLNQDLDVLFSLHGTAQAGKDFRDPGRVVHMTAGQSQAVVEIEPLSDELDEPMETVALRLEDPTTLPSLAMPLPSARYQIDQANRTAAAVIFDRVRPEQGALEFALPGSGEVQGAPISMLVTAYHPTADLNQVDFFADEALIGSSEIIFDKPSLGGLVLHHFDWKDPVPGDHVLTARAKLADGTSIVSSKVSVTVPSPSGGEAGPPTGGDVGGVDKVQFRQVDRQTDGTIQLRLSGPINQNCTLEMSSDLIHWTPVRAVLLPQGVLEFQDQVDRAQKQRFYRTR